MPDNVINKVVFEGRTLVDLTDTTATAETILSGYGAYGADGVWVDGTATAGSLSGHVWQDNEGYIHLDDDGGDMYITTPLNVTTNGTYTAPTGVAYTPVSVQVSSSPTLQAKTNISPTTSSQTITADSGYDGLSSVQINAMPSGSATTPATTVTANPSISVNSSGLITATASATKSVTPTVSAGYVSSGTAGTITVSGSNTSQLTTQAAQTIHPSSSDQTITSGKYLTGTQTIKGVTTTNLSAGNIKSGVTVEIGDSTDSDCVTSVTGTYTGGGGAEQKQINFIDYDGTILHSYTASEWANVSALPSNPSHTGLVAQGWNWTKSEIDAQLTAVPDGDVWVGQQYVTSSGDTEIEVEFDDPYNLSPNFTCAVDGSIRIDWGDGSATTSVINSSLTSYVHNSHTYSSVGRYTIVIHVLAGSWAICGNSMAFLNASLSGSSIHNSVYSTCVKRVRFGNNTYLGSYAFYGCMALESITMLSSTGLNDVSVRNSFYYCLGLVSLTLPRGITTVGNSGVRAARGLRSLSLPATFDKLDTYSFYECEVLKSITIPYTVTALLGTSCFASCRCLEKIALPNAITTIYNDTFRDCYSLRSVKLGNSVTSIGSSSGSSYAFGLCHSLGSITLPSTVTDIKNYSFYSLYNLKELHMMGTTPPTLGTNNFNNLAIDYRIYVPYSADHSVLEVYKTATNWSSHSIHMVEESP